MNSASFMPRPDIHGALLSLFWFVDEPVEEPEPAVAPPVKPEYDERFAFDVADSCTCHNSAPCSWCVDNPEEQ